MPLVSTVLIIGAGDLGERFAAGLAAAGQVRGLILVSRSGAAEAAATIASSHDSEVESQACDARHPDEVAKLIFKTDPDLIVLSASGLGPWTLAGRGGRPRRAHGRARFRAAPAVQPAGAAGRDAGGYRHRLRGAGGQRLIPRRDRPGAGPAGPGPHRGAGQRGHDPAPGPFGA